MPPEHYKPDHASLRAFLMSEQLNKPVRQVAREIRARAKARTPRGTGKLAESYKLNNTTATGPMRGVKWSGGRRRIVEIVNDDAAAAANEFGQPRRGVILLGHHMLRNAGLPYHTPLPDEGGFQ